MNNKPTRTVIFKEQIKPCATGKDLPIRNDTGKAIEAAPCFQMAAVMVLPSKQAAKPRAVIPMHIKAVYFLITRFHTLAKIIKHMTPDFQNKLDRAISKGKQEIYEDEEKRKFSRLDDRGRFNYNVERFKERLVAYDSYFTEKEFEREYDIESTQWNLGFRYVKGTRTPVTIAFRTQHLDAQMYPQRNHTLRMFAEEGPSNKGSFTKEISRGQIVPEAEWDKFIEESFLAIVTACPFTIEESYQREN